MNQKIPLDISPEELNQWILDDFSRLILVDVRETDHSFLISADIPGLTKKDINIEVSDDVLSITGERTEDKLKD